MTTSTLTVTEFMEARIAEDEERARDFEEHQARAINGDYGTGGGQWATTMWHGVAMIGFTPARVLAECAAMRKIVEMFQTARPAMGEWESDYASAAYDAVRALASIWSDHPQFDPAWA
jgi:hypothetical protein